MSDKLNKNDSEEIDEKITPGNIPKIETKEKKQQFLGDPELRKISNPLDLTPNNPILKMLKIPGVIFASTISGYLVGKFSFKPFYLLIIGHCIYAYYKRRVLQYKLSVDTMIDQNKRIKETAIDAVANMETVEWINYVIRRIWLNVEASVSSTIHSEVNKVLKANCPKQLKSIKLSEITLGTQPPVIEKVKWFDRSDDKIVLEMDLAFVPLQDDELTAINGASAQRSHWNTCVQLSVVVNSLISLPILVRNLTFAGSVHLELSLLKEEPFVKAAKFYFLKVPEVDFVLIPLKICDFMDLPFLSSFVKNTFNKQIGAICVHPNEINVDLSDVNAYKGKKIGVIGIRLHKLITRAEGVKHISVSVDGKKIGETEKVSGANPLFENEMFYAVIKDTTKTINMTVYNDGEKQNGQVFLRNLNKHVFTERINMMAGHSASSLFCTSLFYQKTEKRKNSAILSIKCRDVRDLCKTKVSEKLLYNTYVMIRVLNIQSKKKIGEFETKRIFASKNPIFNESFSLFVRDFNEYLVNIQVMDDKTDTQIGYVNVHLSDIHDCRNTEDRTTYRLKGKELHTGEIDFSWEMEYIDIHREEVANILSSEDDTVFNSFSSIEYSDKEERSSDESTVSSEKLTMDANMDQSTTVIDGDSEIKTLVSSSTAKEPGAEPQKFEEHEIDKKEKKEVPDLSIGIYHLKKIPKKLINFKKAVELVLKNFSGKGSYFFVFETDHAIVKLDPFTTKMQFNIKAVLPLYEEEYILIRLFKITTNGDVLIGEELVETSVFCTEREETSFVSVFEKIRAEFFYSTAPFRKEIYPHKVTISQLRFDKFNDFVYNLNLYDGSGLKYITEVFERQLLYTNGSNPIKIKHDGHVTELEITKGNKKQIILGENNKIEANVSLKPLGCDFDYVENFMSGSLEVNILKATKLPPVDNNSLDPFVTVYLNKEQIYKSEVKKRTVEAEYNESFTLKINKSIDRIGFSIFDYNRVASNEMIVFTEFALHNVSPGFSKHELVLQDAKTGMDTLSKLVVLFNFKKMK